MGNFNRNKRSGRPEMHKAVCDECGRSCEVPFKPSGGKPIYCSDCFKDKGGDSRKSDRRDFGGRDSKRQSMYKAVCDSCGQNCEVPFKPTSGKPVYCDSCFSDKGSKKDRGSNRDRGRGSDRDRGGSREQSSKQLNMLNEKLDRILKILITFEPKKEVTAEKKLKKVEPEKKTVKVETEKKIKKVKKTAVKKTATKKPAAKKAAKKKPAKKKAKVKKKK